MSEPRCCDQDMRRVWYGITRTEDGRVKSLAYYVCMECGNEQDDKPTSASKEASA